MKIGAVRHWLIRFKRTIRSKKEFPLDERERKQERLGEMESLNWRFNIQEIQFKFIEQLSFTSTKNSRVAETSGGEEEAEAKKKAAPITIIRSMSHSISPGADVWQWNLLSKYKNPEPHPLLAHRKSRLSSFSSGEGWMEKEKFWIGVF